jgi:hypothetical protein
MDFFGKLGGFLNKAKETVQHTVNDVGNKLKEMEIKEKIITNGTKALEVAKATGDYVVEKSKEAYVNKYNLEI